MKNKYKIKVKAIDIKRGVPQDVCRCPVALAIRRVIKKAPISVVFSESLQVGGAVFSGPIKIDRFIDTFDKGGEVKPFSFVMRQYNG